MPSFKTSGKSKEDLSLVAQISGLLNAEETNRMTRTELVRFLEEENKKAERLTTPVQINLPTPPPTTPPLPSSELELPAKTGKRQIAASRKRPNARVKATKDTETELDPALVAQEPVLPAELPAEGNAVKLRLVRVKKKESPAVEPIQITVEKGANQAPPAPVAAASGDASVTATIELAAEAPVAPIVQPARKSGRPRSDKTVGRRKTDPAAATAAVSPAATAAAGSASATRPGRRPGTGTRPRKTNKLAADQTAPIQISLLGEPADAPVVSKPSTKAAVVIAKPAPEADQDGTEKKIARKGGRRRVIPVTPAVPTEPVLAAAPIESVLAAVPTEPVLTAVPTEPGLAAIPTTIGSAPMPEPVEAVVSPEQAEAANIAAPEVKTASELSEKPAKTGKSEETTTPELTVKRDEVAAAVKPGSAAAEITGQTEIKRQVAKRGRKPAAAAQQEVFPGKTAATNDGQPASAETEPIPTISNVLADKAETAGDTAAESSPEASEAATERELESPSRIIRHRPRPADREMTGPIERQTAADAATADKQPAAQTPPYNRPGSDGQYQPRPGRPVSRVQSEQTGVISRIPRAHTTNRATHTSIIQPSGELLRERQDQEQPDQMPDQPREQRAAQLADQLDPEPGAAATITEAPPAAAPESDAARNADMQERTDYDAAKEKRPLVETGESQGGVLEIMPDGYGFLRKDNYLQGNKDIYVPPQYIRRFGLRPGDFVTGPVKLQRENDRYQALLYIKDVNGQPPEKMLRRVHFDRLTPIYPEERFVLETTRNELSTRIIDLVAPIGKGQRGMIVSPPKAGKTILLQKIANAISVNNPDTKLIVLLIDERPEEVTDMQRSINGEVVYSTFDKTPENHTKVVELVLERAMRLVELKQDVIILLDSMTRLARAYNLTINPTGRTLSGGLDPGALYGPKRFFGAARNIENGGSLTIIATSLIETGSRMDEVIFEEFKGTGNMEVYLDRKLSEKRIFPAIDINKSGTRREELLMNNKELDAVWTIRKAFSQLDTSSVTEAIINLLLKTKNNEHFISSVNVSFNDKNVFEAMRGTRPGAQAGQGGANNQGGANSGAPGYGAGNTYNNTGYGSKYQRNPGNEDD